MKVNPVTPVQPVNFKKQLTQSGCCDKVIISSGSTYIMFGKHQFIVNVVFCTNCGSVKATSNIKEKN